MNTADATALIGAVTALVVAIGTTVATILTTIKQNKMLAAAAVQRQEQAVKLEEVHVAVTGSASAPSSIKAPEPTKPPPLPGTPGLPLVFVLIGIGASLALTPYALCSCGPDKPVLAPNPTAADCIADRTQAQLDCVKKAATSAAADACIADVKSKKECVDGGH